MHPAYSVILFTTASGAGYGLLVWLVLGGLLELVPIERGLGVLGFGLAFGLITAGLLSSTAHLGRPERAWRAFSQWRTSWLSREGVLAVATYVPAGITALGWVVLETIDGLLAVTAVLSVLGALVTIYTTGMIYASLRTIRQWHQPLTAPIYVVLGLASGAVLLDVLLRVLDIGDVWVDWLAGAALIIGAGLKWAYWMRIDGEPRDYTAEAALGLGHLGKVRPLEPPHTQPNFVMREMGYRVARKHALKLRKLALLLGFGVPLGLLLLTSAAGWVPAVGGALLAALAMAVGFVVERWLFFAEAEHVSMLYYGAEAA
ncbi:MAG: dimethyl sulfoxide reductase anchor subunit [Hyphomonadaceae bacterium]|nr:dimethyl sulfoxide reductase anchor subunit [Hyphomonadaceae bacterium]